MQSHAALVGLTFKHSPPSSDMIIAVAKSLEGVTGAWFASLDDNSRRAAQWTQDPQQLIPTGRLSVHFQNTRTQQHAYNVLSQRLPDMHFYTCECTLAKPFESHVNNQIAGTLQLCCFLQREDISRDMFVTRWLDDHTSVALETQCTVGYRQNLVTQRPDQDDDKRPTLTFDAIVEEYFPTEASTSTAHFFDAADNPIRLKENVARMHKSCMRFISFSTIMVIHLTDRRII